MIGWQGRSIDSGGEQGLALRIAPFPTGRIMVAGFPGIPCLDFGELSRVATIISSLRDDVDFAYVDANARPQDRYRTRMPRPMSTRMGSCRTATALPAPLRHPKSTQPPF
jgi:hypothetical protein